jgi:hypothetical protein
MQSSVRGANTERRSRSRYPIARQLKFTVWAGKAPVLSGAGTSINVSSKGMLFRSASRVRPAEYVTAAVDWPLLSSDGERLLLVVSGPVVRMQGSRVAMSISRHELVRDASPTGQARQGGTNGGRALADGASPILVVDDSETYLLMKAMLRGCPNPVEHVTPAAALDLLAGPKRSIGLLITSTLDEFTGLPAAVPVVYTTPAPAELPASAAAFPSLTVLEKPIRFAELRAIIRRASPPAP